MLWLKEQRHKRADRGTGGRGSTCHRLRQSSGPKIQPDRAAVPARLTFQTALSAALSAARNPQKFGDLHNSDPIAGVAA
eukprot:10036224-Alexandrium_andersonii.AAC.1